MHNHIHSSKEQITVLWLQLPVTSAHSHINVFLIPICTRVYVQGVQTNYLSIRILCWAKILWKQIMGHKNQLLA